MSDKKKTGMGNKSNSNDEIAGLNIYKNDKGQTVMYVKRTGTGYLLKPSDRSAYSLYHNRIAIAIAVFMILASFVNSWKMPLIVGVILYILLEFRYRKWLQNLSRIENFKPERRHTLAEAVAQSYTKPKAILLMVLYLAFGILLVVYMFMQKSSIVMIIGSFVVLAGCLYMAYNYLHAIMLQK